MDSLDCAAVLECLTGGTLCAALDSLPESDAMEGFQVIAIEDGECVKISWDSLMTDCQFELEIGSFGGVDCAYATTCDGGNTYSNIFWQTLGFEDCTLTLTGNAEGGQSCVMSEVELPFIDSVFLTNEGGCPTFNFSKCRTVFQQISLPQISVSVVNLTGDEAGKIRISVGYAGYGCGGTDDVCVCDLTAGCSGINVTGVCGNATPLIPGQQFDIKLPNANVTNVYAAGIREYRRNRDAKKDPELKPGDLYLLKGSNKLRFKR
jgi:hypothetical protein